MKIIDIEQTIIEMACEGKFVRCIWDSDLLEDYNWQQNTPIQNFPDERVYKFNVKSSKVNNVLSQLLKDYLPLGLIPYISKEGDDSINSEYEISLLKGNNKFTPLVCEEISAVNYSLETEDIISKLQLWDSEFGIELIGAGEDWCLFIFKTLPLNIESFIIEDLNKFCPDFIGQSTYLENGFDYAVKISKDIIFYNKQVRLWWD